MHQTKPGAFAFILSRSLISTSFALTFVGTALALDEQTPAPITEVDQSRILESMEQYRPTIPSIEIRKIEHEKITIIPGTYARALSLIMKDLNKRGYHDAAEIELMIQEKSDALIVATKVRDTRHQGRLTVHHGGLQYTVSRQDGHIIHIGHWR